VTESPVEVFDLPLFPLSTVLFPGGLLPLRIFEARYLDMISECMKADSSFAACLLRSGSEVGGEAVPYEVGTLASVRDFELGADGLLNIVAVGGRRCRVLSTWKQPDRLLMGRVELLSDGEDRPLPAGLEPLAEALRQAAVHVGTALVTGEPRYDDAIWVGYRLAEGLPVAVTQKQRWLEMDDPVARLEDITVTLAARR
jgi:Lon protease-like protein